MFYYLNGTVALLDAGADDYVIKPFDGDVLAARLRAVMRRSLVAEASDETVLGDLHIDRPGMSVRRGDERISLSSWSVFSASWSIERDRVPNSSC